MRILVLGSTGMLGFSLISYLQRFPELEVRGTVRTNTKKLYLGERGKFKVYSGVDVSNFESIETVINGYKPDYILNCIGIIKQGQQSNDKLSNIEINARFPHLLADCCDNHNARLIHFSTDCVFLGTKGNYNEKDPADALDYYGKSKFLGEINRAPHLTLRTSIIGHELETNLSLVDWFLSQKSDVSGFSKAIFSGLPTRYLAQVLYKYVLGKQISGLFHLSLDPISKFDLLNLIKDIYKRDIKIINNDEFIIDRSLDSSKFSTATGYKATDWSQAVAFMHDEFIETLERRLK